ncbi:MAG: glycosyltransferase, partial [Ktedonobacteraceae bacterium]
VWEMLRAGELDATSKVRLLLDFDRILGFGLREYLLSDTPARALDPRTYLATVPASVAEQVEARHSLRQHQQFGEADELRTHLATTCYTLRDTPCGSLVLPRRLEDEFPVLSSSNDAPDYTGQPDQYTFSINLLAHNSHADLARCLASIQRYAGGYTLEVVIVDNGSTDETLSYLQALARDGSLTGVQGQRIALQVLFADHNMGFAAGRNATLRASRGRYVVLLDTSIELTDAPWALLTTLLEDPSIGVTGPYGLLTNDLREFREAPGPDVDAIEGYLMAWRRELQAELGRLDEHFRFYRLLDIHLSFFCKSAGYRVVASPQLAQCLRKHPHREWFSLSEDERATKSKKNYDLFHERWHHGQSLLVANYQPRDHWCGHEHARHVEGDHTHASGELPPAGVMHSHTHQHWPDHAHEHAHYHTASCAY